MKLDDRRRITLPPEAASLFENGLVAVEREGSRVVLKPVKRPLSELVGLVEKGGPFPEMSRKLEKDLKEGRLVL